MHSFLQIYKEGSLTSEKLRETGVAWKDVFEEIPIHVRNSPLAAAMLACVEPEARRPAQTPMLDIAILSTKPFAGASLLHAPVSAAASLLHALQPTQTPVPCPPSPGMGHGVTCQRLRSGS